MKAAQNIFALAFGLLLTVGVGQARAAQVTNLNILLSETRPSPSDSYYTVQWTTASTATLTEIEFWFCDAPSGTCTAPSGTVTTGAQKGTVTGPTSAEWTLSATTAYIPKLQHITTGESIPQNTVVSIEMQAITNHAISDCDAEVSSDTCFMRVYTFTDNDDPVTAAVDEGVASYTVVEAVVVTARVDPLFTFIVAGTSADAVYNDITTSVASTYSTLPFSNLTANTPRYTAHSLTVTTNTESGYTVDQKLVTALTGVYSSNNIDPFISPWGTPTTWTEPTGSTPSVDTGWIGASTTDTEVPGWASPSQKFGPVGPSSNTVMIETGSDDGSTPTYVVYGIEANVFQPADTYTGALIYIALPKY